MVRATNLSFRPGLVSTILAYLSWLIHCGSHDTVLLLPYTNLHIHDVITWLIHGMVQTFYCGKCEGQTSGKNLPMGICQHE